MRAVSARLETAVWRMKLRRCIANLSDRYYSQADSLAREMVDARIRAAQVRSLESVAYGTEKVSDVLDLVKTRIGRDKRWRGVGEELLSSLSRLRGDADRVARDVGPGEDDLPRQVHLKLCREFLKHVAAHFTYLKGQEAAEAAKDEDERG